MKKLKCLILRIDEEIESAKDYAETYIELLSADNQNLASKYKEMAQDELKHSNILYDEAVALYDRYKMIADASDLEVLKNENNLYLDKTKQIKMMLNTNIINR